MFAHPLTDPTLRKRAHESGISPISSQGRNVADQKTEKKIEVRAGRERRLFIREAVTEGAEPAQSLRAR